MAAIFSAFQHHLSCFAPSTGSEVATVVEHVRQDETYIARQRAEIALMRSRGCETAEAEKRLAAFESARRVHNARLRLLAARCEAERWAVRMPSTKGP